MGRQGSIAITVEHAPQQIPQQVWGLILFIIILPHLCCRVYML